MNDKMDFNPKDLLFSEGSLKLPLGVNKETPSYNPNVEAFYMPGLKNKKLKQIVLDHELHHAILSKLPSICFQRVISRFIYHEFTRDKFNKTSYISTLLPSKNPTIRMLKELFSEIHYSNAFVQEALALQEFYHFSRKELEKRGLNPDEWLEKAINNSANELPPSKRTYFKHTCNALCKSEFIWRIRNYIQVISLTPLFFFPNLPLTKVGKLDTSRINSKVADHASLEFRSSYRRLPYSPRKRLIALVSFAQQMEKNNHEPSLGDFTSQLFHFFPNRLFPFEEDNHEPDLDDFDDDFTYPLFDFEEDSHEPDLDDSDDVAYRLFDFEEDSHKPDLDDSDDGTTQPLYFEDLLTVNSSRFYTPNPIRCLHEKRLCPIETLRSQGLKIPFVDFGIPRRHLLSEDFGRFLQCRSLFHPYIHKEKTQEWEDIETGQYNNSLSRFFIRVDEKRLRGRTLIRFYRGSTKASRGYLLNWPFSAFLTASEVLRNIVFGQREIAYKSKEIHLIDYYNPADLNIEINHYKPRELDGLPDKTFYQVLSEGLPKLDTTHNLSPFITVEIRKADEFLGMEIGIS